MNKNWYLLLLCVPVVLSSLSIVGYLPKFEFLYTSVGIFSIVFITFFTRLLIKTYHEVIDEFILLVHYLPIFGFLFTGQLYFVNLISSVKDVFSILIYFTIAFMIFSVTAFILLKDMSFRSLYSILFNKEDSRPEEPGLENISTTFLIGFFVLPALPLLYLITFGDLKQSYFLLKANIFFTLIVSLHLISGISLIQKYPLFSGREEMFAYSKVFVLISVVCVSSLVTVNIDNLESITANTSLNIILLLCGLIWLSTYIANILDYTFSLNYKDKKIIE